MASPIKSNFIIQLNNNNVPMSSSPPANPYQPLIDIIQNTFADFKPEIIFRAVDLDEEFEEDILDQSFEMDESLEMTDVMDDLNSSTSSDNT